MQVLGYFDAFCTRLIEVMAAEQSDERLVQYITQYIRLVEGSTYNISPFIQARLDLIKNRFAVSK